MLYLNKKRGLQMKVLYARVEHPNNGFESNKKIGS